MRSPHRGSLPIFAALLLSAAANAQTTQGLISGRVVDSRTGAGLAGGEISYQSTAATIGGLATTDRAGYFVLPLLSPGFYKLRVGAPGYQAQELYQVDLPVAGRLDYTFRLRALNDVWEAGQYRSVFQPNSDAIVTFYGPDVDTSRAGSFEATRGARASLESSLSQVIDSTQLRDLPFQGRDVYTMLVTQPGVTADGSTARGLGLAINGQRPSSSNFLLDGLENNNYLVTGPLNAIPPEGVQEYRVSTSNFSAEYGRTSGFLANAVSRAGGNEWHGVGYYYFKNDKLNANGFQQNLQGLPKPPVKESQPGFFIGGPIKKQVLLASSSFEYFRFRSRGDPEKVTLPTTVFTQLYTAPGSISRKLLEQFPAPAVTDGVNPTAEVKLSAPSSVNRTLALPRLDYLRRGGAERVLFRVAIARFERPDFIWTPYKDFVSPMSQNTTGAGVSWVRSFKPHLTNEARFGWSDDVLRFDRARPDIPTLVSDAVLPGSPSFYEYRNHGRSLELVENLIWTRGRHILKFGGGWLHRNIDGFLTAGRDGYYAFLTAIDFAIDQPFLFLSTASRAEVANRRAVLPAYDREYRYNQAFGFFQDSFKLSPRLVLNFGGRYESLGAPVNTGAVKDAFVRLGSGSALGQRLAGAAFVFPSAGNQQLYDADRNDFAVRAGFSWSPRRDSKLVARGSYGVFYDRPFENLWQNLRSNNFVLASASLDRQYDYLTPVPRVLSTVSDLNVRPDFPTPTLYQPELRNAYVHSYFGGLQYAVTEELSAEISVLGSLGHKLITTDAINRPLSLSADAAGATNFLRYYNPNLPLISYRGNQGFSNYHAVTATARYRGQRSLWQASYSYSKTVDNQSEPLAGDFFDLSFTRIAGGGRSTRAAFSRQFDSSGDRGNSDFDQRHNFIVYSIWDIPSLLESTKLKWLGRGWKFSQLAAVRTGFPFSVTAPTVFDFGGEFLFNNRANVARPGSVFVETAAKGGRRLLNPDAFVQPDRGKLGTSARNGFRGPGFYNLDVSLSRTVAIGWLGESVRLQIRADAFNLLNHTNLANPDAIFSPANTDNFGIALFGRKGRDTGFPAVSPLAESARQVQVLLRLEF